MNKELNLSAEFIRSQISIGRIDECILTTVDNGDISNISHDIDAYQRVMMDVPYRFKRHGYTYKQAVYHLLSDSQIKRLRFLHKIFRYL